MCILAGASRTSEDRSRPFRNEPELEVTSALQITDMLPSKRTLAEGTRTNRDVILEMRNTLSHASAEPIAVHKRIRLGTRRPDGKQGKDLAATGRPATRAYQTARARRRSGA